MQRRTNKELKSEKQHPPVRLSEFSDINPHVFWLTYLIGLLIGLYLYHSNQDHRDQTYFRW